MEERVVGGKAYNLDILTKNGINIPRWFVVTSTEDNFEVQDNKLYAVRSSAVGEDGSGNSFAGQMESFLYVKAEDIKARIHDVINSANSDRIKFYMPNKILEIFFFLSTLSFPFLTNTQ